MNDCLFCKIIDGKIPSRKVYEDDATFAFLDIAPVNLGHVLVVPKSHHATCDDMPDGDLSAMFPAVKRIAAAAVAATGSQGYNVVINCGPAAGQVVMHTHVHVIPRSEGDGLHPWPKRDVTEEEMQETAAAMTDRLKR
jgi:histidine triad (HIT) family protein